jgi:hypothetical protein
MKKIILIIFVSLMFSNIGFAKTTLIEHDRIQVKSYENSEFFVSTVCVDGYKFVVARAGRTVAISMVQLFTRAVGGVSLPKKC